MPYTPTTWVNTPSGGTNINAADLNHAEQGILDVHEVVSTLGAQASQLSTDAAAAQAVASSAAAIASAAQATADGGIPKSNVTTKGDLIVATAANTPTRLPAGETGQGLVVDSTAGTGLAYSRRFGVEETPPPSTSSYSEGDIVFVRRS